jgi:Glycosyltransferase
MKITVIADVLGEENNGTTTACMNLVRYLKSMGDEVSIVCCDKDKRGKDGYFVVDTYNLGPIINKMVRKNNVSLAKPQKKIIYNAIKDADIIHVMMPFALGKKATRLARKLEKPVTAGFHVQAENFTTHVGMMNFSLANYITYKNFYRKLYRHVDGVHYPTEFIRETFEKRIHHKTNGFVISNGVHSRFVKKNVDRPENLKDKYLILFTGRYSKEKSHKVLIKAVSKCKYKDEIQLIFAGQGPCDEEIRKCAKKAGINMPIMRFFKKDELVDVINYCDLYCHPAEIEIEAIACLEAISCGLVPIISNSPRCATKAFAIDSNNLFKCNDSNDLAKKIDYWIEHPEEKDIRSNEYIGYTKQYNQDECMQSMRDMMIKCMGEHKQ